MPVSDLQVARDEKLAVNYLAMVHLGMIQRYLRVPFSERAWYVPISGPAEAVDVYGSEIRISYSVTGQVSHGSQSQRPAIQVAVGSRTLNEMCQEKLVVEQRVVFRIRLAARKNIEGHVRCDRSPTERIARGWRGHQE